MGGLFSRTVVVDLTSQYSNELKQIETDITTIQTKKQAQLSFKRTLTRSLILYGTMIWFVIILLCLYLVEFPNRNHVVARCLKIGPIILWPVMLLLCKSGIDSYYTIQFKKTDATLAKLEKSKETKLDELMAKTNFKATQQLISQFSEKKKPKEKENQPQQQGSSPTKQPHGGAHAPHPSHQQHGPRFSTPGQPGKFSTAPASAFKMAQHQQQQYQQQLQLQQQQLHQQHPGGNVPPPPSNSLAGSSRGPLDKVLDFILNDGPNNQYALICTSCAGHNGLVREQDLGKIRFRCALCGFLNGPPLPPPGPNSQLPPMTPGGPQSSSHSANSNLVYTPAAAASSDLAPSTPFTPAAPRTAERSAEANEDVQATPAAHGSSSSSSSSAAPSHSKSHSHPIVAPTAVPSDEDEEVEEGEWIEREEASEMEESKATTNAASPPQSRRRKTRTPQQKNDFQQ